MGSREGYLPYPKSFETTCIHHAQEPQQWTSKAVIPHIVTSTVFHIDNPAKPGKFTYSRVQNPNRQILEKVLAALNKAKFGLAFASGMSALMGVFGLMKAGDHVVCSEELNGETFDVFNTVASNFGIGTTFVNFTSIEEICGAIRHNTKLLWTENPSDPTCKITDISAVSKIAKEHNLLFGVDNTYLTPYLQRPLELGADVVTQSLTKYVNGHSDTLMGSLCCSREEFYRQMHIYQTIMGLVPSPFDCYQVLRGMKTLNLRMEKHHESAMAVANYLEKHELVEKVLHPGLSSHPQHKLYKQQASGHNGIISFYLKGGLEASQKFIDSLNYFTVSEVGGGNESTAQIPSIMSHKTITKARKDKLHIKDNLVRISVGLENICDLICDLEQSLGQVKGSGTIKEAVSGTCP